MNKTTFPLLLALCVWADPTAILCAQDGDAALRAFFQDYLERHFRQQPMEATELGDHRFDHLLDDLSRPARDGWVMLARQTLEALPQQVDYARLSRAGQIDFEILQQHLKRTVWLAENTRPFEEDPRVYNAYVSDSVYLLLTQSTLPKETNVANGLARMAQILQVLASARANLQNPPRVILETAIRQNRGALAFYQGDLFQLIGETPQRSALQAAAQKVVVALQDYQKFLEQELLPRAQGDWRLGREKFRRKLELVLDAGLTAEQVMADAETEFARVTHEMYVIARQLWSRYFPKHPLPPDDTDGRRATIQQVLDQVAREHGRAEDLVRDVSTVVADLKQFIAEADILRLPDPDRCQIIEMPEFQRGNSTAYMNSPPPLDPNALGQYAVSPPPRDWDPDHVRSYLEEYNRHMLKILTIHEAYPGHYVQFEYSNRNPSLIRRVLGSGVFVEGWAVYTEQTLLDQGYGQGDLALRLTQLKFYLRAVANAILDHRMHCSNLSDEDALQLLTRDAFQSEGEARLKIIRSKQSSCQLSTYFAGRMALYRLRQKVQREESNRFNLGAFHEALLDHGPVPVKYLPELVRERLTRPRQDPGPNRAESGQENAGQKVAKRFLGNKIRKRRILKL
jgi:uncharacterized protein (DUF885 family)